MKGGGPSASPDVTARRLSPFSMPQASSASVRRAHGVQSKAVSPPAQPGTFSCPGVRWGYRRPEHRQPTETGVSMVLATAAVEDFDKFLNTFSTKVWRSEESTAAADRAYSATQPMRAESGWSSIGTRRATSASCPIRICPASSRRPAVRAGRRSSPARPRTGSRSANAAPPRPRRASRGSP